MKPILSDTFPVVGNGLGGLPDAIECVVSHEINGIYELQMRYPVTGQHFDEIESGRFIMAKPDDLTSAQPFRVYRITKPLNGVVTVYARHICYDMQGIVVEPFTAGSLTEAFQTIPTVLTPANAFNLQTTRTVASGITLKEPRPLWKLLGGQAGSLLDVYGGEWDFDGYDAKLVTQLGTNRGVTIRYGKNMTEMEQDASIESAFSGVYPFWYDEETNTLVTLTEKYVTVPGAIVSDRVLTLDCSDDFDTQPSEQDLRDRANAYITANSVGNAKSSWKVSFVDTRDLPLDKVQLGDTLGVHYERLNVDATARAVKTEYDVLADRYKAITIGKVKQNLAQIIVDNEQKTDEGFKQIKSDLEGAVDDATDFIKHGAGDMRFIYNASDELVEIVSLDDPDIAQAQSVWRWNNGGFGHSSNGYNGTYDLAITQNGAIVADFITAGTLNANVIRAGVLQDALGKNSWNLDTGALTITDGSLDITTNSQTYDAIILNYQGWHNSISPLELKAVNDGTSSKAIVQAGGVFVYSDTANVSLYNSSNALRSFIWLGGATFYAGNNSQMGNFDFTQASFYDTSGNLRTHWDESALNFYDANGDAEIELDNTGLKFSSGGTQTAIYPANPSTLLKDNGISANGLDGSGYYLYSSTGTTTISLTNDKTYLVTLTRRNSTDQSYNAMWLVSAGTSNSSVTTIKSGTGSSASVSGLTLSITRGTAYSRVTWLRLN